MDGIGGDLTINPRGGMALAYFLRQGKFLRFLREFAAYGRSSGQAFSQALRSKVIFPLAPIWTRRAWLEWRGLDPAALRRFVAPGFVRELRSTRAAAMANMPALQTSAHMRRTNTTSLRDLADRPRSYYANEAAAYGLELTRPMLDRRVVEFGLAVPEDIYVVDGRRRYLARRALADVYPSEYQTREDYQDALDPDFADSLRQSSPQIRASLQRLRGDAVLRRYFAFDAMAEVWDEMSAGPIPLATATYALRAFQAAAYARWLGDRK
jgi:asparagine synthase (glutamine-hydrolysing)